MAINASEALDDARRPSTGEHSAPIDPTYVEVVIPRGVDGGPALAKTLDDLRASGDVYVIDAATTARRDPTYSVAVGTGLPALHELVSRNAEEVERVVADTARREGAHIVRVTDGTDRDAALRLRDRVPVRGGYTVRVLAVTAPEDLSYANHVSLETNRLESYGVPDPGAHLPTPEEHRDTLDQAKDYVAASSPLTSAVDHLRVVKNGHTADSAAAWQGYAGNWDDPGEVVARFTSQAENNSPELSKYVLQVLEPNFDRLRTIPPGLQELRGKHSAVLAGKGPARGPATRPGSSQHRLTTPGHPTDIPSSTRSDPRGRGRG